MEFQSETELYEYMKFHIIPELLEFLATKVERVLKKNLMLADISTDTLQDYVTHSSIEKDPLGYHCDIFIDADLAQMEHEGSVIYGETLGGGYMKGHSFVKFISLNGDTSYGGKSIVWNMVNWLENTGAYGVLGNNPIEPIGMFEKTEREIESKLDVWTNQFLKKYI